MPAARQPSRRHRWYVPSAHASFRPASVWALPVPQASHTSQPTPGTCQHAIPRPPPPSPPPADPRHVRQPCAAARSTCRGDCGRARAASARQRAPAAWCVWGGGGSPGSAAQARAAGARRAQTHPTEPKPSHPNGRTVRPPVALARPGSQCAARRASRPPTPSRVDPGRHRDILCTRPARLRERCRDRMPMADDWTRRNDVKRGQSR